MVLYADGVEVAAGGQWTATQSVTLARLPSVLAVSCEDRGVVGGILVSLSSGARSDNSWRCAPAAQEGWNQVRYCTPLLPRRIGT
jgi:hypothetical protein